MSVKHVMILLLPKRHHSAHGVRIVPDIATGMNSIMIVVYISAKNGSVIVVLDPLDIKTGAVDVSTIPRLV